MTKNWNFSRRKSRQNCFHILKIFLVIMLIFLPVAFVWNVELIFVPNQFAGDGGLTNGFWDSNGLQVYHVGMYALFFTNFIVAGYVMWNMKK